MEGGGRREGEKRKGRNGEDMWREEKREKKLTSMKEVHVCVYAITIRKQHRIYSISEQSACDCARL